MAGSSITRWAEETGRVVGGGRGVEGGGETGGGGTDYEYVIGLIEAGAIAGGGFESACERVGGEGGQNDGRRVFACSCGGHGRVDS
jgi:hypothetical protein